MAKVAVIGAGAIGGWIAARLGANESDISVLGRGETLAALQSRGLVLEQGDDRQQVPLRASSDPGELGVQDLIIIAVKEPALAGIAAVIRPMIGPQTTIVPMLNGVPWWFMGNEAPLNSLDPNGTIADALPYSQVIGCVVHASASCPAPGHVHLRMADRLLLGEPGGGASERVSEIVRLLADAGLPAQASENIRQEIWFKLWGNMTMNPLSALTLATADRILDDPLVERLILSVMAEAQAIGQAIGCPIDQRGEDRNAVTRKLGAFKTSMLQDVEAGRAVELDALLAAPREIAAGLDIPTPMIDALFGIARLMASSRGLYGKAS